MIALALLCVLANCEKKAEDTTAVTTEAAAPVADAGAGDAVTTDAAAPAAE